ncbi:MAG: hypothetical protein ABSA80_00415 [Terriglobales bacterium]|jgi:hypothetical protein
MHVHANQINPNTQFDAVCAAERAAANREAARTRKKLSEFASKLAAALDSGDSVKGLGPREESQEPAKRQNQQSQGSRTKPTEGADTAGVHNSISDWA